MCELQSTLITCPICGTTFDTDDEIVTCERCNTPHHKDCWEYADGCAIFACDSRGWRMPATFSSSEDISTTIEQWRSAFSGEWSAFSSMGIGVVLFSLYLILLNAPFFARQGLSLANYLLFPSIGFTVLGYVQLIVAGHKAEKANEQLNGAFDDKVVALKAVPPSSITARMEMSSYQRSVDNLLTLMLWFTIIMAMLGFINLLPITLPTLLIGWLTQLGDTAPFLAPVIWSARALIRRRNATITATRNRIEASLEKLKSKSQ